MNNRKKLTDIQAIFQKPEQPIFQPEQPIFQETEHSQPTPTPINPSPQKEGSLSAKLQQPKKASSKIRFTLDLEHPLDDRLNRAANKLNRTKAELTRIALEMLLEKLEQEWS